jgi:hypothetical protein
MISIHNYSNNLRYSYIYIHVYTYIHTCTYIYIHMYIYIYVHILYTYIYVYIYMHMYIYICINIYLWYVGDELHNSHRCFVAFRTQSPRLRATSGPLSTLRGGHTASPGSGGCPSGTSACPKGPSWLREVKKASTFSYFFMESGSWWLMNVGFNWILMGFNRV